MAGHTASAWSCVGGTQNGASVTLALGQSEICTINNEDQPGSIIIQKFSKPVNTGASPSTNTNAIKTAQEQAASFNTQGDSSTFTPGTSADSKFARSVASKQFWDVLP